MLTAAPPALAEDVLTALPPPPHLHRHALAALNASAGGANWQNVWPSDADPCSWHGVDCYEGRHIVGLALNGNGLTGTLPSELGLLSHLSGFEAIENEHLSGTLPALVAKLHKFSIIDLFQTAISGTIPAELTTRHRTTEVSIGMSNTRLSGTIPQGLLRLPGLLYLEIDVTRVSGTIPTEITYNPLLETFGVATTRVSGTLPVALSKLHQLKALDFGSSPISGTLPTQLGRLHANYLEGLSIGNNRLSGTLPTEVANIFAFDVTFENLVRNSKEPGEVPHTLRVPDGIRSFRRYSPPSSPPPLPRPPPPSASPIDGPAEGGGKRDRATSHKIAHRARESTL